MAGRIADSLQAAAPEVYAAATSGHHLEIGPGEPAIGEWAALGLELPNLSLMRTNRLERIRTKLNEFGYDGIIVMDPLNIRYATDTTNMQIWVMHNGARYAYVGADGHVIVWDYVNCEFLSGHSEVVDEVRPALGSTYFLAGPRYEEQANRWADEMIELITQRCGPAARIAVDQCHHIGYQRLAQAGISIGSGQEVMENARLIKGPEEIKAMRCAVAACENTMLEIREQLTPGMTEREVWALLHAGNIRRAGEWIETQILASGPRTNPWMQEVSSRVIENGDIVAYDTDLVGAYGMMCDVSRTWIAGDRRATPPQRRVFDLAKEQVERNLELMVPGRTFHELTHKAWIPPVEDYRHYSVLFHGVGQCDEHPDITFPEWYDEWGFDGVLEPGMVLTVEAFVGHRDGGPGAKLENQVLITENGPERLDILVSNDLH